MDKRAIAEAFSTGNFEPCLPYVTQETIWNTPGEQYLTGKGEIEAFCRTIAAYFASVTTDFRQLGVIEDDSGVAINGTAEFIRDGQLVSRASSCDVYRFDESNRIISIHSYCITERETPMSKKQPA
ncbi:nuclear transport factor 2 family protein [Lewinella sp. IMCC34191]|uniref:nuclear transport factor 2 family protein n=1 Tax=Lewinella sp. IMCC34191 TaxID=2259172 RepID=UPI000E24A143|nr:nuclear transport factor 2 family protein [Lewinella sp. IMCC34191]